MAGVGSIQQFKEKIAPTLERLIDVGSGSGHLVLGLRTFFKRTYGIEVDPLCYQASQKLLATARTVVPSLKHVKFFNVNVCSFDLRALCKGKPYLLLWNNTSWSPDTLGVTFQKLVEEAPARSIILTQTLPPSLGDKVQSIGEFTIPCAHDACCKWQIAVVL